MAEAENAVPVSYFRRSDWVWLVLLFTGPGHLTETRAYTTYQAARDAANEYRQRHGGRWNRWQTDVVIEKLGEESSILRSTSRTTRPPARKTGESAPFTLTKRAMILIERTEVKTYGPLATDVSQG
jgi:hypothetical protein